MFGSRVAYAYNILYKPLVIHYETVDAPEEGNT